MSRKVEITKEIDAPIDAVWRALTEARSLEQWFPVEARVAPGPGGTLWLSWGEGAQGEGRILHWEPNKRFGWGDELGGVRIATDFFLEARGAKTVVRVVTSGFSADPSWEDDFHMMEGGWKYFMSHLQVWLERHRDQPRVLSHSRQAVGISKADAFGRLARALGFADPPLQEGRFAVSTSEGDALDGNIVALNPGVQMGLVLENLDHAMLFVEMEGTKGRATPALWLSTYGLDEPTSSALGQRMRRLYLRALT